MGCNVMKFELPTTVNVTLYPKNRFEECFILGTLVGQGYCPTIENTTIFLCVSLYDIEEFKIQMECLEQDIKRYSERFIDYTV